MQFVSLVKYLFPRLVLVQKGHLEWLVHESNSFSKSLLFCKDVEQSAQGRWNESPATNYMSSIYKSKHWCACKETPDLPVNACTQNLF